MAPSRSGGACIRSEPHSRGGSPETGAASRARSSRATWRGFVDELTLVNRVHTTYLGDSRVRMTSGGRSFEADQRTKVDRPGASFCPLELVAAALGA
jgi:hypothetical protein